MKKRTLCVLAAILMICGEMLFSSCSENDIPVVVTSAVDNGVWFIDDSDMDSTVNAGNDFFMYCNGG